MNSLYIESSAIVHWLLGEPLAEEVSSWLNKDAKFISSVLTPLEISRTLVRVEVEKRFKPVEIEEIRSIYDKAILRWELMDISQGILHRAARQFPVEPVRSLDAIHLATALEFLEIYPELEVLSLDRRIVGNLEPLGLRCCDIGR